MSKSYKKLITIKLKQSKEASAFIMLMKEHKIRIFNLNFKQSEITFQVAHSNLSLMRRLRKKRKLKLQSVTASRREFCKKIWLRRLASSC